MIKYEKEDTHITINDDPSLKKFDLKLPSAPDLKKIDGYGKSIEDQRFEYVSIPIKLQAIETEAYENVKSAVEKTAKAGSVVTLLKIQKEFWRILKSRKKELKKEINFIRKTWWHRINGYWFFNRGKPTYITGRHYFYLNFFYIDSDSGRPEYRDCDRREYIFMEYCWTCTETFSDLDEEGVAVRSDDGSYKTTDLGRRVCFGSIQSKNRRRGNTSKAISDGIEIATRTKGEKAFGIQSYSEESGAKHYAKKLLPAWEKLPIWLKPYSKSGKKSKTIEFAVSNNDYGIKQLGSSMYSAPNSSPQAFDGQKMICLLTDEEGKEMKGDDVNKRWKVNKHTLAQGDGMKIHGFSYHPSTVDQMDVGSQAYRNMADTSCIYTRIKEKGQTPSGLFLIFIPAQDGLEGYIDSYGYSVTGEVKDYQKKEGFTITAEEYLMSERKLLMKQNTPESMDDLREHKKLYPMQFSDSWLGDAGVAGFNIDILDKTIEKNKTKTTYLKYDLVWVDNVYGGKVEAVPNINGRFEIAEMPYPNLSNNKELCMHFSAFEGREVEMYKNITNEIYVLGADPFNFRNNSKNVKNSKKLSDGGIAIYKKYDRSVDGDRKRSERVTDTFVLSYRYSPPSAEEYNEDVLKAAIFFGANVYPETNAPSTYDYFIRNKFGGYLLYDIDRKTGRYKTKPGVDSLEGSKQEIFTNLRDYIEYRGHQEPFTEFLEECKKIPSIDKMRYYDRLAAHGVALLGATRMVPALGSEENTYDVSDFLFT